MKKIYSIIPFILILTITISSCNSEEPAQPKKKTASSNPQFKKEGELFLMISDSVTKKIEIEIANNDGEREQGLMNRPWMEESQGMLFIFDAEQPQSFWMKNTIIALDIIYINSKKQIVSISKDCQPFSEKPIPSGLPAQYVLEVISGFTDKYNVQVGTTINWNTYN